MAQPLNATSMLMCTLYDNVQWFLGHAGQYCNQPFFRHQTGIYELNSQVHHN